jgi:hypothetical protein
MLQRDLFVLPGCFSPAGKYGPRVVQVDETLTHGAEGDVRERRRIEIRLRKYEGSILYRPRDD